MNSLIRVSKSINQNALIITLLLLSFFASTANAQGVAAGTVISNTATIDFYLGNAPLETIQASNNFVVAETINATITSLDASSVVVPTPATDKVLTWLLTNRGNGTESFTLSSLDNLISDDFNPTVQTIWQETNGIPGLQNTDTLYQSANPIQLASDQSQTLYVRSNIPNSLLTAQQGNVELSALSTTAGISTSAIGDSLSNVGDGNIDAVVLINNGRVASIGTYIVSTVDLQLNKTVASIVDPFSGTSVMSQSLITYQIDVNAVGDSNGVLENLVIEDVTPANMQFIAGSIKLNGSALTDVNDADSADFDITTNNTVTINLGDITPPSNQIITITYQVN